MRGIDKQVSKVKRASQPRGSKPLVSTSHEKVKSTNLKEVWYNSGTKILTIKFQNNRVYEYKNVPSKVFSELIRANSKGTYHNLNIKNRFAYIEK